MYYNIEHLLVFGSKGKMNSIRSPPHLIMQNQPTFFFGSINILNL